MHDVQAAAALFVGESATMVSESVVLGTPSIYIDEVGRGYTDEEARQGLLWMFRPVANRNSLIIEDQKNTEKNTSCEAINIDKEVTKKRIQSPLTESTHLSVIRHNRSQASLQRPLWLTLLAARLSMTRLPDAYKKMLRNKKGFLTTGVRLLHSQKRKTGR